jgi:hypothetical protein
MRESVRANAVPFRFGGSGAPDAGEALESRSSIVLDFHPRH